MRLPGYDVAQAARDAAASAGIAVAASLADAAHGAGTLITHAA
ncbi:MAG: hypothetical protein WDN04_00815 [Rhodospirillales bacterium]